MFHKKVDEYPLWAWILAAISAPVAQFASSGPWLGVLGLAILCSGLCWGIHALSEEQPVIKRWYCVVEFFFLILISGEFARMASTSWPTGNSFPTVSLTLLILAACSAMDGADRASRVGGVIFLFLALLYAVVLAAGVKNLKINWIMPSLEEPRCFLAAVLLVPAVASFLPRNKGKASAAALITTVGFAVVVALLTTGTMSPNTVNIMQDPFYEFSKSLSLFGVAERFEAVVSVALTLSYFALLSFLFSAAGYLAEGLYPGCGKMGVITCAGAAAVIMLICPAVPEGWLTMLSVLFWGILPLLTKWKVGGKKSKKIEKGG